MTAEMKLKHQKIVDKLKIEHADVTDITNLHPKNSEPEHNSKSILKPDPKLSTKP